MKLNYLNTHKHTYNELALVFVLAPKVLFKKFQRMGREEIHSEYQKVTLR